MSPSTSPSTTGESNTTDDSGRLALPPVDTSMRLWRDVSVDEAKFYAPGVGIALLSLLAGLYTDLVIGLVGMVIAGVALVLGGIGHMLDRWWTSALDRTVGAVRHGRRLLSLPIGEDAREELARLHGIRQITDAGVVVRDSGARVTLIRVHGTNTATQTAAEDDALARQLGRALDEDIKTVDIDFHSTTRPADLEAAVGPLAERARTADGDFSTAARAYLQDVAQWTRQEDANRWGAHEWRHYAVVRATPAEVEIDSRPWDCLPLFGDDAESETTDRLETQLTERSTRVQDALASVDGLKTERVGPAEAADVAAGYWSGRGRVSSDDRIEHAFEGDTARVLAPDVVDQAGDALVVGDERVRTVWIVEWPPTPDASPNSCTTTPTRN